MTVLITLHDVEPAVRLNARLEADGVPTSLVSPLDDVRAAVDGLPPCPGRVRARKIAGLADGLAESEQETRLRLLLGGSGLPRPVAQYRIFDAEGFVAK